MQTTLSVLAQKTVSERDFTARKWWPLCQHIRRSEMASTACQRNANQKVNENLYLSDNKKEDSFSTKLTTPCVDYTQTLYAQTQKAILVYAVVKSGFKFFNTF